MLEDKLKETMNGSSSIEEIVHQLNDNLVKLNDEIEQLTSESASASLDCRITNYLRTVLPN
jgi:hypothetical protein